MLHWCEEKQIKPPPAWLHSAKEEGDAPAPGVDYGYRVTAAQHPQAFWSLIAPNFAEPYLRHAQRGLSTPAEIEAELAANGLPPLAVTPEPERFDPMAQVWWTLPMTAA
jgi:hypothetical protein